MKRYDTIIIGFGKAGKTTAGFLAGKGENVALIEKSNKMYGGTCINVGCIPSKSLVTWSSNSQHKGLDTYEEKNEYFKAAMSRKETLTSTLRGKNFKKLDDLDNVTVINGLASFVGPKEVQVETENGTEVITADKIIINTGSKSRWVNIPGASESKRVFVSNGMLDLGELPQKLVIVGGGYIGLEFASIYAGFGSEVTVLESHPQFLGREDEDVAEAIRKSFEDRGVKILTDVKISNIEDREDVSVVKYTIDGKELSSEANAILLATGRVPNTESLNLEKAGIKVDERGAVVVDEYLRTSVENVWAAGDVVGGLQFTYISLDDFRVLRDQFNGVENGYSTKGRLVPNSVFIQPSFSRVGLSEKEAKAQGYDYQVVKMPAAAIPKANVLQKPEGLLKAIIDNKTGKILGCVLFCEESYEMINTVKIVMDLGGDYTTLRDNIFTHPTMSESLNDLFGMVKISK